MALKEKYNIMVIGGGISGFSAALKAADYSNSVGLLSEESFTYRRAALNSVICGHINTEKDLEIFPQKEIRDKGVKVYYNCKVLSLKYDDRTIIAETRGNRRIFQGDTIVIATGSIPYTPQIAGIDLKGVYQVKWLKDVKTLSSYVKIGERAAVIGAGLVGIEIAEALSKRGLKVTLIEKCPYILPQILAEDFSEKVTDQIRRRGLDVLLNNSINSIGGKDKVTYIIINGEKIKTDVVVFATGFKPNISLLKDTDIKLDDSMAIKTSRYMETNVDGIYASGDCAESIDLISGSRVYRPLGTVAARSGEIAGLNAAGKSSSYRGFIRRQYDHIFGLDIVSMGLTRSMASNMGIQAYDIDVYPKEHLDLHTRVCNKLKNMMMKVLINEKTNILIGFQVIGSAKHRSWYSLPIQELIVNRSTIDDLSNIGLHY